MRKTCLRMSEGESEEVLRLQDFVFESGIEHESLRPSNMRTEQKLKEGSSLSPSLGQAFRERVSCLRLKLS